MPRVRWSVRLALVLAALSGGALGLNSAAVAQPANDACASAQAVVLADPFVQLAGTNVQATADGPSFCSFDDNLDVWYALTASRAGVYGISTIGTRPPGATTLDTTLSVFTGTCAALGEPVDCNDDIYFDFDPSITWLDARVSVTLAAGQTALIRVAGVELATGTFMLTIAPPALNDTCAAAQPITLNETVTGSNLGAITNYQLPAAATTCTEGAQGSRGWKDVYYTFTPPGSGSNPYRISLCPTIESTGFDSNVAVLAACGGAVVACNEDVLPGATCYSGTDYIWSAEIQEVMLTGSVPYIIRVAGYDYCVGLSPSQCFPDTNEGIFALRITAPGVQPGQVVCCRGTTCTLVADAAACTVPAGPVVGAVTVASSTECNAAGGAITPCCYADFDKAGGRTIDDIFIFLNAWFANSPYTKIGGDGVAAPNLDDIFVFLNAWFAGC